MENDSKNRFIADSIKGKIGERATLKSLRELNYDVDIAPKGKVDYDIVDEDGKPYAEVKSQDIKNVFGKKEPLYSGQVVMAEVLGINNKKGGFFTMDQNIKYFVLALVDFEEEEAKILYFFDAKEYRKCIVNILREMFGENYMDIFEHQGITRPINAEKYKLIPQKHENGKTNWILYLNHCVDVNTKEITNDLIFEAYRFRKICN